MKDTEISDMAPPETPGESEAVCSALDQKTTAVAKMPENPATLAKPWTLAHAILGKHKTLTSSIVTVTPNGSFNNISVLNVGRSAVLNQWHDDGRDDSLVLSRLPNWSGAESAKTSVIRPSHESEPIKIVFNKPADTWSEVSSRAPSAFPLIVERDVRSFPGQSSTTAQFLLSGDSSSEGSSQQSIKYTSEETRDKDLENITNVLWLSKRQEFLRRKIKTLRGSFKDNTN
jgi:hypothetical protein